MHYCCTEENLKVQTELRVSLCYSLCKHTAKRQCLRNTWLKRAGGWPKEAGPIPARRWNNLPKGSAIPEFGEAGRKQTHSLKRSLGGEKPCWRWTGFKTLSPEALQLHQGPPAPCPRGGVQREVPCAHASLPTLASESQQGFIYFSPVLQQMAVTVVIKHFMEKIILREQ